MEYYYFLIQEPNNPASDIFDKYKVGKAYTFKVKLLGVKRIGGGNIYHFGVVASFKDTDEINKVYDE